MGTYGYHGDLVVDFRMIHCRMGYDINDRSRWGVVATTFMKNILVENCTLSRVDVHMGVSGAYMIRGSTRGHAGLNAIGRGRLVVDDSKRSENYRGITFFMQSHRPFAQQPSVSLSLDGEAGDS
jgi:hypothetical protein